MSNSRAAQTLLTRNVSLSLSRSLSRSLRTWAEVPIHRLGSFQRRRDEQRMAAVAAIARGLR